MLDAQSNRPEDIMGFFFDELDITVDERKWERTFGDFKVIVEHSFVFGKAGPGAGMIIHQGHGKFWLVGWGFQVLFKSAKPNAAFTGILYALTAGRFDFIALKC